MSLMLYMPEHSWGIKEKKLARREVKLKKNEDRSSGKVERVLDISEKFHMLNKVFEEELVR